MPYIVKGTMQSAEGGTFTVVVQTRQEAFEKAATIRAFGLDVQITGPDGRPVDETKGE